MSRPKASRLQLVFMTYAVVCSGAYGIEEMVSASGPGLALLTLVVLPFLWAVPVALACAELSARHPVEGGYYRWARLAFGDLAGYTTGWLVWLSMFATNALFAVLFANYLAYFVPELGAGGRFAVALALVASTTFMNHYGIRIVGAASIVLTIAIFVPFLWLTAGGLLEARFDPTLPFRHPGKTWPGAFADGLFIAIWAYSGWEKLTTSAEEVDDPARSFPLSLAIAVPTVAASYVLPTVAALAASGDWAAWGEAHFSQSAEAVGGAALGATMAAGGLLSNFSLLLVTILAQSRLPLAMAEDGLFPAFMARLHPRHGTPTASLVLGAIVLGGLCLFPFADLAGLFSLVQVGAYLLILGSLFKLRSTPARAGGFRIPLGRAGLATMASPVVALALAVLVRTLFPGGAFAWRPTALALFLAASGPGSYALFIALRRRSP